MQSFGDFFASNRLLAIGLLLAAVALILAVGIALFRLVFGRRLHMSGGRTRQPRLGVVDAFDLDRQRQLVLVRRDNVEHLLMIGGPNDVVVESAIVRASPALTTREKENGVVGTAIGVQAPQGSGPSSVPVVMPIAAASDGSPPVVSGAEPSPTAVPTATSRAPEPVAPSASQSVPKDVVPSPEANVPLIPPQAPPSSPDARLPPAPLLPAASRSAPGAPLQRSPSVMPSRPPSGAPPRTGPATPLPPRPTFSRATPVPPGAGAAQPGRIEPAAARPSSPIAPDAPSPAVKVSGEQAHEKASQEVAGAAVPSAAKETPRPAHPMPVESPLPAPPDAASAESVPPPPLVRPVPSVPRSVTPLPPRPSQPNRAPTTTQPVRNAVPSFGSLEEEMAKLLGRPMPPPDQPGS